MWPLCEKGKLDATDKMGEEDTKSHISINSYSVGRCVFPPGLHPSGLPTCTVPNKINLNAQPFCLECIIGIHLWLIYRLANSNCYGIQSWKVFASYLKNILVYYSCVTFAVISDDKTALKLLTCLSCNNRNKINPPESISSSSSTIST